MSEMNTKKKKWESTGFKHACALRRKRIIEYYETVANRSKTQTVHQFKGEIKRVSIYEILRKHEQRKRGELKPATLGRKCSVITPENLQRYGELYRMDPMITNTEAGELLNLGKHSMIRLRRAFLKQLNQSSLPPGGGGDDKVKEYLANFDVPIEIHDNDNDDLQAPSKPVKLKKGRHFYCLACFQQFEESPSPQEERNKLSQNLNAIFVIRRLLDLTPEDISELMKLSKWRDPGDWFNICEKCSGIVEECLKIHAKIRRLEGKLEECKEELKETIRNTSEVKFKKKTKNPASVKPVGVTKRIREMVGRRESISMRKNPFEEGDKEAEVKALELVSQSVIVVKQEIEDVPPPMDHLVDFSSSDCDLGVKFETGMESSEMGGVDVNQELSLEMAKLTEMDQAEPFPEPSTESIPVLEAPDNGNENAEGSVALPVITQSICGGGDVVGVEETMLMPPQVPLVTQGICDVCGVEMRPLAIPTHKFMEHDFLMDGYTAKYCRKEGCNYKTLYDAHLQMHMQKHETKLNYSCRYCEKKFNTGTKRNAHEIIHKNAGTRPYQCELCGASFAVKQYLYHHTRISHQRKYYPSMKLKQKSCHK